MKTKRIIYGTDLSSTNLCDSTAFVQVPQDKLYLHDTQNLTIAMTLWKSKQNFQGAMVSIREFPPKTTQEFEERAGPS